MVMKNLLSGVATIAAAILNHAVAQPIEWTYYTYLGVNDKPTQTTRAFAEDIFSATNGRLRINVLAGGQLPYKVADVMKAVATNQVQIGEAVVGGSGDLPEINVLQLPFLCTSYAQFKKALPVVQPIVDQALKEKFALDVLMHWSMPPQNLWLNREISTLSDLRGMKIRTWSTPQVEMMRALQGSAISMSSGEVIPALERKVIDGAITSSISANDWHAYEIIKSGYMGNLTMGYQIMIVNSAALAKLPPDVRDILVAKASEWTPRYMTMSEEGDIAARQNLAANGVRLVQPSAEDVASARSLMQPIWNRWAQSNGPRAAELLVGAKKACGAE